MSRQFLVEAFLPTGRQRELPEIVARLQAAVAGTGVRHVRCIAVPEDEVCFHLFDAESEQAVVRLARAAGVDADRVIACRNPDWVASDPHSRGGISWLV